MYQLSSDWRRLYVVAIWYMEHKRGVHFCRCGVALRNAGKKKDKKVKREGGGGGGGGGGKSRGEE